MAVWRSVPRSVRRQVGENFGPTCGDLAALWAEGTDHHRDAISVRDKLLTHALSRLDTTGDDLREYVEAAIGLPDHPPGARRLRVEYEQLVAPTFERRLRTAESIGLVAGAAALGAAVAAGVVVDGWMWWVAAVSTLVAGVLWATSTQIIESREHYPLRLGVAPVPFAGLAVGTVAMAGGDALGATRAVALAIGALGLAIAMLVSVRLHRRIVAVRGTHGYRATAAKHSTAVRALQDASQESTTIGGSRETSGTDDSTRPRLDAPTRAERLVALSEMYDFTYELVRGQDGRALRAAVWTRWFDSAEPVDMWTRSRQTDAVAVISNVLVNDYLDRLPADGLFAVGELHHSESDDVVLVSGAKARFVINQFGEWRSIWDPAGDWFVGNGRHEVYAAGGEGRRIVGLD